MNNLIPEGIYKARATTNWALSETSKGTPYAHVEFEILNGAAKGRTITKDFFFSEKAWKKSVESLRACGWQGDDVSNLAGVERNEVVCKVVHELVTDKDGAPRTDDEGHAIYRNTIAWVGEDRTKPMEASKLSSFRELMRARLRGQADAAPLQATGTDDDLPDFMR